jgi:hypothetical protein
MFAPFMAYLLVIDIARQRNLEAEEFPRLLGRLSSIVNFFNSKPLASDAILKQHKAKYCTYTANRINNAPLICTYRQGLYVPNQPGRCGFFPNH